MLTPLGLGLERNHKAARLNAYDDHLATPIKGLVLLKFQADQLPADTGIANRYGSASDQGLGKLET